LIRRLFALVILLGLAVLGLYYWRHGPAGLRSANMRQVGQDLEDVALTGAVRAALGLNRTLKPYAIEASAENGVVTLRGEVPSVEVRQTAEAVAGSVPKAKRVSNELKVNPATRGEPSAERTMGEVVDDQTLEVQVKMALSLNKALEGSHIDVKVYRKAVTLSGDVKDPAQRGIALETARQTAGVSSVTDTLGAAGKNAGVSEVERVLNENANLKPYGIRAREQNGHLVLLGRVRTGAERDLATLLAQQVSRLPVENSLELQH